EILEVHLMADARARRHDAEVVQRVLPPSQELVPLAVALELLLGVDEKCCVAPVLVDLYRMVDDEVDRLQRVDALRISAKLPHGVAHRGEIHDAWHAGEILQQHPARSE